jgi:hypothetical protein
MVRTRRARRVRPARRRRARPHDIWSEDDLDFEAETEIEDWMIFQVQNETGS